MPLSRIQIEQIGPSRWHAEVEAGNAPNNVRRRGLDAPSFDDVLLAVVEAHADMTAPPAVKVPVLSVLELEAAQSERIAAEVEAAKVAERAVYGESTREELLAEASRLGVEVDGRWGMVRIQEAIDAANARGGEAA